MEKIIEKYLSLIDDIFTDFLGDIKSLRYQLVLGAFAFNIYLFTHGADVKVQMAALGLLSIVYGLYFQSKKHQAELESKQSDSDTDITVERDPEA